MVKRPVGEKRRPSRRLESPPDSLAFLLKEVRSGVDQEVARCLARVTDQASALERIGLQLFEAAGDVQILASPSELTQRSHRLRALVHYSLGVLLDLQCEAGRLDSLATMRERADAPE